MVDTWGVVPGHNNSCFVPTSPLVLQTMNCIDNDLGLQPCDRHCKKGLRDPLLGTTALRVSTICLPDIITHDQISQAFPLCICILQAIKCCMEVQPEIEQGYGLSTKSNRLS